MEEYGTEGFFKQINEILSGKGKKHYFYPETVEHAQAMGVHVEGNKPTKLLEINRPNEPDDVKKYRLEVYRPKTKSLSEKVVNTVNRIFNPRLFHITYPESPSASIPDNKWIGTYMTEGIPYYESLMRFVRETYTKKDFGDPNAWCVLLPLDFEIPDTEFYEPVPFIYQSSDICLFKEDEYLLIKMSVKDKEEGKALYIDRERIVYFEEEEKNEWKVDDEYPNITGQVTAFRLGGVIMGNKSPYWYHSFISGVLPHWDDVVTLSSDLQAGIVNHLYLEKWEYTVDCDDCGGSGKISAQQANPGATVISHLPEGATAEIYSCRSCAGTGKRVTRGPFNVMRINKDAMAQDVTSPIPPAGYIDKPIEIIDKIKEIIKEEKDNGLSSINMEIISKVGEDQSGVAKTIDRQDLDSFLLRYSNHCFDYVIPNLIYYTMVWRYGNILTDQQILENFPTISKPKAFEVLDVMMLQEEMKKASEANVSSNILKQIETEIVNTRFSGDEFNRKRNLAIIELDPLYSKSADELMTLRANGVVKREDWQIHAYMDLIIDTMIEEDEKFLDLKRKDQRVKINAWVQTNLAAVEPNLPVE
jgi:hypothetical protein